MNIIDLRDIVENKETEPDTYVWTWSHQCVHIWEARLPHASYGF